jgi:phage terminase large subunit-like protein
VLASCLARRPAARPGSPFGLPGCVRPITTPAARRLGDAVVRQRLLLPDDPELREHAANAVARQKPRGWRIEAPDRSSNVDGVVALMMALDRLENRPQPTRFVGWL